MTQFKSYVINGLKGVYKLLSKGCLAVGCWQAVMGGMLLLGVIKEVQDYELVVSLANGLDGVVQITHISDAYTQLLQKLAAGQQQLYQVSAWSSLEHDLPGPHLTSHLAQNIDWPYIYQVT